MKTHPANASAAIEPRVQVMGAPAFNTLNDAAMARIESVETLVNGVVTAAFNGARMDRSVEYLEGVRAALFNHALRRGLRLPYVAGTAQADAFFAGVEEGHTLWRRELQARIEHHYACERAASAAAAGTR